MTIGSSFSALPSLTASQYQTLLGATNSSGSDASAAAAIVDPLLSSATDSSPSDGIDALFGTSTDPASAILGDLAQETANTNNEILTALAEAQAAQSASSSASPASGSSSTPTGASSSGSSASDTSTTGANTIDLAALAELSATNSSSSGGLLDLLA
jgi:hypothetical protein